MKRLRLSAVLILVSAIVAFVPIAAQNAPAAQTAPTVAKHAMDLEDILAFRAMNATSLSPNGQWVAYRLSPLEGDSEVIVKGTAPGAKELKFPVGENGGAFTFSQDSAWIAITTQPTRKDAQANTRARRPNQSGVTIVNLATGEKTAVPKIRRYAFSGEAAGWIALHRYGPDNAPGAAAPAGAGGGRGGGRGGGADTTGDAPRSTAPRGTDLILHELKTGTELNVGNVSEWNFNKSGRYLALVIDAADQAGNGIQLRDMQTGTIASLDTDKAFYERMTWTQEGDALAALKGHDDRGWRERLYALVGFTGIGQGDPKKVSYDPASDTPFPKNMAVSGNRAPQFTEARDALLFGIANLTKVERPAGRNGGAGAGANPTPDAQTPPAAGATPADDTNTDRPNLVIWHYKDSRLQTQQQVQEPQDRNFSYATMFRLDDKKLVRLADEESPTVNVTGRGRWAIGTNNGPYELQGNLDGIRLQDIYAIDTKTGRKTVIKKGLRWGNAASPDTTKYLYYDAKNFYVFDTATGIARNITAGLPTSFVDTEDDHNVVDPPTNVVGWTADSANVLISDRWDIWKIPVAAGAPGVNLTVNGRKDQIRYQARVRTDPDERGIDLTKPQYFSAMAEWTKRGGYGVLEPAKPGITMLLWEDAAIRGLAKAEKSDVWMYTRETPTDATGVYVTDATLKTGRKVVDTSAEAAPLLWTSGAQLIEYRDAHKKVGEKEGARLQGSLYLPANYEKGKQYPLVVYIYERQTQSHFTYGRPTANGFSRQAYTSNGYAVLMPDITYFVNDPGMSAVWALVPAVQAAIATGVVDPKRVALHGHSWGGYQTAFTITQTNIFAAAIAGAPLTDMISMYSVIYKNTGGTNGAIFEASQGRFTTGPWDNWDAYSRNSPVYYAKNVKTPLIILHNDQDGAVDFTQGIEYFNTLRRMGKSVVLLEYPGENHGLARPANQQDYTVRMKEFFDHYLKEAPAPDWLEYGVPRLKMQEHIDQRLKERADHEKEKAASATPAGGRGGR
jgi:dipeptidyl aminopeptidase/acylaminoacyl peptidase